MDFVSTQSHKTAKEYVVTTVIFGITEHAPKATIYNKDLIYNGCVVKIKASMSQPSLFTVMN